jgi:hypothetical protein
MTKISNQYSLTNVLTADVVNGRVGINNGSPTVALDVTGAGRFSTTVTAQTGFKLPANGNGTSPTLAYNNSLGFGVSGTGIFFGNLYNSDLSTAIQLRVTNSGGTDITAMTITPTGNVGIGTSSPGVAGGSFTGLDIRGSGGGSLVFGSTSTVFSYIYANSSALFLDTTGTIPISFNAGGTEKMRIHSSGVVSIGNTNNGAYRLDVTGEIITRGANVSAYSYEDRLTTSNTYTLYAYNGITFFYNAGNRAQINMSSGAYTALSDINKKKNFEQSTIGLNEVMKLKPTLYNLKSEDDSSPKDLGFIAQEVNEFIPQAYVESGEGDDKFIGLNQMPLIAALTKAIQELSADLTSAKQEIELLKAK